jgi:hypothetical protein
MMRIRTQWLEILLCASALQGCALMHSPAKEMLGKEAKDAWEKTDLRKPVEVARTNYEGIYTRQMVNIDDLKNLNRDNLTLQLAVSYAKTVEQGVSTLQAQANISEKTYPCKVDAKLGYCSFASHDFSKQFSVVEKNLKNKKDIWRSLFASAHRQTGKSLPSCAQWMAADGRAKKPWLEMLSKDAGLAGDLGPQGSLVTSTCTDWLAQEAELRKLLGSSGDVAAPGADWAVLLKPKTLPAQLDKVDALQLKLDELKAQAAQAQDAVAKAEEAGKAADDAAQTESALTKLQEATAKFEAAADKVLKASAKFPNNPFLKDLTLKLKKDSLSAFFKTVKDAKPGESPPATSGKAAAAAVLFSNYFDTTTKRLKEAQEFGLAALALEEQLAEIERQRVQREIAVQEQRIKLAQMKVEVMQKQLEEYLKADGYLTTFVDRHPGANLHDALLGKPVDHRCPEKAAKPDPCYQKERVTAPATADARTSLWLGFGTYMQAQVTYPHRLQQLTTQEQALESADRLAASELNLQVWDTVVTSNINQLAHWASFGITKDEFQKAINNVLTGLIAVGVLK